MPKNAGEATLAWLDKIRYANGSQSTAKIRLQMQKVMQNYAAVFRTQETLQEGDSTLVNLGNQLYHHVGFAFLLSPTGVQKIDETWETFSDVKISDRSLTW